MNSNTRSNAHNRIKDYDEALLVVVAASLQLSVVPQLPTLHLPPDFVVEDSAPNSENFEAAIQVVVIPEI